MPAPTSGDGRWPPAAQRRVPLSRWRFRTRSIWCWPRWAAGRSARFPIPMHWDLPEWERDRVREVIDPAVVVDDETPVGAGGARGRRVRKPAARRRFAHRQRNLQQRVDRRAQSDPQPGAVAVDTPARRAVSVELDTGGPAADDHGARADVSHQRLRHLPLPAGRRPPGDTRKVRRGTGCGRDRTLSDHQLHRHAHHAGARSRPGPTSGSATCPASSSSCRAPR